MATMSSGDGRSILFVAGAMLAAASVSCALVTSFDAYDDVHSDKPRPRLFRARGSVEGLDDSSAAVLTLNGVVLRNAGNGPFVFPACVADGVAWRLSVSSPDRFSCTIRPESGTIAGGDILGVLVHCVSADSALEVLSFDPPVAVAPPAGGALIPAFTPNTYVYGLYAANGPGDLLTTHATVRARDVGATVTVAGESLGREGRSSALTLTIGKSIRISVTAADAVTTTNYTVTIFDGR